MSLLFFFLELAIIDEYLSKINICFSNLTTKLDIFKSKMLTLFIHY